MDEELMKRLSQAIIEDARRRLGSVPEWMRPKPPEAGPASVADMMGASVTPGGQAMFGQGSGYGPVFQAPGGGSPPLRNYADPANWIVGFPPMNQRRR